MEFFKKKRSMNMRNIWIQFYYYPLQPFLAWRASQGSQPYQQWECLQCHHRLGPITINYPHLLLGTKMKKMLKEWWIWLQKVTVNSKVWKLKHFEGSKFFLGNIHKFKHFHGKYPQIYAISWNRSSGWIVGIFSCSHCARPLIFMDDV